ncbi:MAG TPA: mobile mystery protein B [Chlamydiales bacterium]|nr:mobile mystery protein B [Chlamydiales bacterium]
MGRIIFDFPEGATPIHDASGLKISWVKNLEDLNGIEAENISLAQRKYLRGPIKDPVFWFDVKTLSQIHYDMFGNVWDWAGKLRKEITSIGIHPSLIPSSLAIFCKEVVSWYYEPTALTYLEKAARIHHKLVSIHLFENGNGRFSRLIADRCLIAWKCQYPLWPHNLHHLGEDRSDYLLALKEADRGNYEPLLALMQKFGASN